MILIIEFVRQYFYLIRLDPKKELDQDHIWQGQLGQ